MSKILFTGGSSLLALNWACSIRNSHEVYLGVHESKISLFGAESVPLELNNVSKFYRLVLQIQPDLIINTTGLTNVEACESKLELAHHINVELAANIASVAFQLKVPLVHISTDHLFSGLIKNQTELSQPCPINEYGRSKLNAERAVMDINPSTLIFRTNFYGWGSSKKQSFSDWIIYQLRAGIKINLFNDVFYTPILISNFVRAAHQLIDKSASGIYNLVGSERLSKYDFAVSVAQVFDLPEDLLVQSSISDAKHLVKRPRDMSLSNSKIVRELGVNFPNTLASLHELRNQEEAGLSREIFHSIQLS
jgi:dTDP-4-dehydrorhamnose reductase